MFDTNNYIDPEIDQKPIIKDNQQKLEDFNKKQLEIKNKTRKETKDNITI